MKKPSTAEAAGLALFLAHSTSLVLSIEHAAQTGISSQKAKIELIKQETTRALSEADLQNKADLCVFETRKAIIDHSSIAGIIFHQPTLQTYDKKCEITAMGPGGFIANKANYLTGSQEATIAEQADYFLFFKPAEGEQVVEHTYFKAGEVIQPVSIIKAANDPEVASLNFIAMIQSICIMILGLWDRRHRESLKKEKEQTISTAIKKFQSRKKLTGGGLRVAAENKSMEVGIVDALLNMRGWKFDEFVSRRAALKARITGEKNWHEKIPSWEAELDKYNNRPEELAWIFGELERRLRDIELTEQETEEEQGAPAAMQRTIE